MDAFSRQISEFQKNGMYVYEFDEGNNLTVDNSSKKFNEHYVSVPLINYSYDNGKIQSFYDLTFTEFISSITASAVSSQVSTQIEQLTQENQDLRDRLNTVIEDSTTNSTESERLAAKQTILDLRMSLKQGVAARDFSEAFPYLPITKPTR